METDIFLKEIGSKVKAARVAKKMSLEKMSELSGINASNLRLLENGKRDIDILSLKNIADVLGVDLKGLV